MGLKEYLSVINRRRYIFFPIVVLVVLSHVVWVAYGQPQMYRASAMVLINPPLTGVAFPFVRPVTPVTRVETFHEPPILNIALQVLSGERPFGSKAFDEPARREEIKRFTESFATDVASGRTRQLLAEVDDALNIVVGKDERVITVEASASEPRRATAFAWSVAEAARIFHNERCKELVDRTVTDLSGQRSEFEKEREVALKDRTEFAKRTGFTNFPRYQEMVQGIILQIDGEISQERGREREIERMIDERVSRSQQGGDEIQAVAAELGDSPRLRGLQEELLKARMEHDLLTSRLTDRHPQVSDLKAKVERVEKLISEEQESIVSDGLKKWSAQTRDLVKQSAAIALKLEVLKERKASLTRELFRLAEISQEYARIDERASQVAANIERVKGHINELEWAGLQALGQVQVHNPSEEPRRLAKRGAGLGPLTLTAAMAVIFGLGVIYLLEYIDTRVKTEHDVRRYLGLPLLGVIPRDRYHLITTEAEQGEIAERFNTVATLLRSVARELNMKTFMVSSAVPEEGKTTVAVNLAASLARNGARVVLVDADLRAPRIHEILNLPNRSGLSTALETRVDPQRIIEGILSESEEEEDSSLGATEALVATSIDNLSVLTSGPLVENPGAILESDQMHRLVKELSSQADFVIFDTPPINRVGDALTVAGLVEGTILVVGSGLCDQHEVAWAKHLLANVQANLVGVILNRHARRRSGESYYYYYQAGHETRKRVKAHV